jgi:predicted TIM-barrel fold metal-dependent hydrolase
MDITRREFGALAAASVAGGLMTPKAEAAVVVPPAPSTAVFKGACDCHVHIIGPAAKYPMVANRAYTPPQATVAQLKALHTRLGVQRTVLVQPSFYGTDNSCMMDALAELGDTARAIAVVPPTISVQDLRAMDAKGVRGIRINLESAGNRDPKAAAAMLKAFEAKLLPLNWHIQMYTALPVIAALINTIADLKVPVVVDHFGGPVAADGPGQKGLLAFLDLIHARKVYVKLSAPYRISKLPNYADVTTIAQSLIYAGRDRMLWATDWPHTNQVPGKPNTEVTPFSKIDDPGYMRLFNSWYPDEMTRKMILVDNPAKLYRFAAVA